MKQDTDPVGITPLSTFDKDKTKIDGPAQQQQWRWRTAMEFFPMACEASRLILLEFR